MIAPPITRVLYTPTMRSPSITSNPTADISIASDFNDTGCEKLQYVADITIPDGSSIAPSASFLKIWRIKNTGTCPITGAYSLVYVDGNLPVPPPPTPLISDTLLPGETTEVSVALVAPNTPGYFRGDFKVLTPGDSIVGMGNDNSGTIYTEFNVGTSLDFNLVLEGFHLCSMHFMTVRVENTGASNLRSAHINAIDHETGKSLIDRTLSSTPFSATKKSCPPGTLAIEPGQILFLSFNVGDPRSKHRSSLYVEICSGEDMAGICVEKELSFLTP